ncbi:MAG: aminotransferase V [Planctomycetes bacterium]|jgi:selenocysteine lyase/cysteine desulfurase|nr:aminotransferase V [Planctomycetota bacterium]
MLNRRQTLKWIGLPALAGGPLGGLAGALERARAFDDSDERYWHEIGRAFTVDRALINLNNGGVSPSPRHVQEAMKEYLDFSNKASAYNMWRILEPCIETVRVHVAKLWGVDSEEIAITRNASEGLQTCQFGFDLEPGDEVLTTTQDYPRMITTFLQRERREGIVLRQFSLPTPCEDPDRVVQLFEENITDRTRMILASHMTFTSGQILPVREIAALGRKRGIPVIIDGAHAFAHFDFSLAEIACDYYATSLHKWLFAPHGTGLLYVRRDKIPGLWPLMAATEEQSADIRKFEQIGTHPLANYLAVAEALYFHEELGPERKQQRLIELRDYWADRLLQNDRVRLNTSQKPGLACGIANVSIDGLDVTELTKWLRKKHQILVVAVKHEDCTGIRVSPSVYTTKGELDRFCEVMEGALANGLSG